MSTLSDYIAQLSNLSDFKTIKSNLLDKTKEVIVNDKEQSIAAVENTYGQEFTVGLINGMSTVLNFVPDVQKEYLRIYFDRFTKGIGLNFSNPLVRTQLDSLSPLLGDEVVTKLKALGIILKSQWEILTSEEEPTDEAIQSAIDTEVEKRDIKRWVNYVKNGLLANNGNGKTIQELKALIQEYE